MDQRIIMKMKKKYGDPIDGKLAYSELTTKTFSAFVRLSLESITEFSRAEIRCILELSRSQTGRILRELNLVGYIKIENKGVGNPSCIRIFRRFRTGKDARFAKF